MVDTDIVLLFVRAPLKGRVKTRLAQEIGDDAAFDLYRCFIEDSIGMVEAAGFRLRICYYPAEERKALDWLGDRHEYMAQDGRDLGERMERAFVRIFSEGFVRAILVGSDIPDLAPSVIQQGFEHLEENDAVLGPASDGGYYLIGFHHEKFIPGIFRGIAWSTPEVLQKTVEAARDASLDIRLLPEWNDIDSLSDLKTFLKRNRQAAARRVKTTSYILGRRTLLDRLQ